MAAKVFISYRRDDAKYQAHMIHAAFRRTVPHDNVFIDIDSIRPGENFRKILKDGVNQCELLLALIGPGWIDATDPKTARRRLDNPSDFVRIEIGEALARGIPVVPVLLDGTPLPDSDLLPDDLKELVDRQAEFVEYRTFDADVERLIKRLGLAPPGPSPTTPTTPPQDERIGVEGRIFIDAAIVQNPNGKWFKPGAGKTEWFKDHEHGPEMVVIPSGSFMMGSPDDEPERSNNESHHNVTIAHSFAVARHAVTRGQFAAFIDNSGYIGGDGSWPGFVQEMSDPVININWEDAKAYVTWLAQTTGKPYRLPTEAEWEYAARAGTTTPFWWGSSINPAQANYDGRSVYEGGGAKGEWRESTVPAGRFAANPWGLYNVHGNV
jgi:formylglycine-generating enzyme required for sulfatase activity